MTAQVLFFDVFSEKDPHLNAVEYVGWKGLKVGKITIFLEKNYM